MPTLPVVTMVSEQQVSSHTRYHSRAPPDTFPQQDQMGLSGQVQLCQQHRIKIMMGALCGPLLDHAIFLLCLYAISLANLLTN